MDVDFVPVAVPRGPAGPARVGADVRRWTLSSASSVRVPHPAPVTDLSFSPLAPYDVAAASGPAVIVVDPRAAAVRRSIARFRDVAHSPRFKHDGRLLVAGCDNGTVQLFDLASRAVLRVFKSQQA
jgi:U3 small nucleolar RNA-associated protein 15